jgi:hypothetical protein
MSVESGFLRRHFANAAILGTSGAASQMLVGLVRGQFNPLVALGSGIGMTIGSYLYNYWKESRTNAALQHGPR